MTGDTGTGGLSGMVPAPAAGDAAGAKFLRADGTWSQPALFTPSVLVGASGVANGAEGYVPQPLIADFQNNHFLILDFRPFGCRGYAHRHTERKSGDYQNPSQSDVENHPSRNYQRPCPNRLGTEASRVMSFLSFFAVNFHEPAEWNKI